MSLHPLRIACCLLFVSVFAMAGEPAPMLNPGARTLDTHHLFALPRSNSEWETRADEIKHRILFGSGLWPMPERTPLNARVTGRYEGPDFIVENVVLTTRPGLYLCGNLYRPKTGTGPFPAIVNPHGHWKDGRLHQEEDVPAPKSLSEKPAAGRANLTGIGVNLARRGFICFSYDMMGYADTLQMEHRTFTKDDLRAWSWSVNLLGLQLWNSIRVIDYLESLPEVDRSKIGATGASGGGSQTFLLGAIEPRIAATVPVNMVSAHMQGGCLCENGPGLRVGTDNAEISAVLAPRPQLLISCTGDWTKNTLNEEYPQIRRVYERMGHPERIEAVQFHYQHNYNRDSREAMYDFFSRWLKGTPSKTPEASFELSAKTLRVFDDKNPRPTDGLNEAAMRDAMIREAAERYTRDLPTNKKEWKQFAETYGTALRISLAVKDGVAGPQPERASEKHGVLIVSFDGDATASADESALSTALRSNSTAVYTLRLPPIVTSDKAQLDRFFCCYNRTHVGDRVQQILDTAATLKTAPGLKRLNVVGLGKAGVCVLLARGVGLDCDRTAADLNNFSGDDAAFLPDLYAPGLRRAGDIRTAAIMAADSNLWISRAGAAADFKPAEKIASELKGSVKVSAEKPHSKSLAEWLSGRD